MIDWKSNLNVDEIKVGDVLPAISIPITLQRLVMEAQGNYDLSLMHHDKRSALTVGASDAFANTFFLMGMYERLLREWAGNEMRIKRIGNMRMTSFNVVDDVTTFSGSVREINDEVVTLDMESRVGDRQTSSAFALIKL